MRLRSKPGSAGAAPPRSVLRRPTVLGLVLLAVAGLLVLPAQTASANPEDRVTASWNMFGENEGSGGAVESRWSTVLPQMFNAGGVQVAALQEAGSQPPARAEWTNRVFPNPGITEHRLNLGTSTRPDNLYIYWGDPGQQRNGLAIVSRERAVDAVQLPNQEGTIDGRPIMGVRFGNDWYFNGHAQSMGGRPNDAATIIEQARQFMARPAQLGQNWMVLADFNYNPGRMHRSLQGRIIAANAPTHQGGHELDFAYSNRPNNLTQLRAERRAFNSDHFWLRYAVNNCRQRDLDCSAPIPGMRYVFFSMKHEDRALTAGNPSLMRYDGLEQEKTQVRYSTVPDRYLISFYDADLCIQRQSDFTTRYSPCNPEDPNQQWVFTDGRISDPVQHLDLAPVTDEINAHLSMSFYPYYWIPVLTDSPDEELALGGLWKRHLRVMPLGDSITYGEGSTHEAGYRTTLWDLLDDRLGGTNFVGSRQAGDMPDQDHEGHSGQRIDQIADAAYCSVQQRRPNVVTLHAGTNDMNQTFELATAPGRLGSLIDQILKDAPEATVLVATLVPATKEGLQPRIDAYNAKLPDIVKQRQEQGKRVRLVNMSEVTTADLAQPAHPGDSGYRKMAQAFHAAIVKAESDGWIKDPVTAPGGQCSTPDDGSLSAAGPGWRSLGEIAPGMSSPAGRTDIVELNGDDRGDYVRITDDGAVRAALNTPGEPGRPDWVDVASGIPAGEPGEGAAVRFADINGDGRDDWLHLYSDSSVLAFENQGIDNGQFRWSAGRLIAPGVSGATREAIRFADVNGDGRDDYLRTSEAGAIHAYINTPDSHGVIHWEARLNWAPGVSYGSRSKLRLADVNGDRRADYLMVGADGNVHAYINDGGAGAGGFTEQLNFVNKTGYPGDKSVFRDISGDGKADYLVIYDGGSVRAWLNRGGNTGT